MKEYYLVDNFGAELSQQMVEALLLQVKDMEADKIIAKGNSPFAWSVWKNGKKIAAIKTIYMDESKENPYSFGLEFLGTKEEFNQLPHMRNDTVNTQFTLYSTETYDMAYWKRTGSWMHAILIHDSYLGRNIGDPVRLRPEMIPKGFQIDYTKLQPNQYVGNVVKDKTVHITVPILGWTDGVIK